MFGRDNARDVKPEDARRETSARRLNLFDNYETLQKILDRFEDLIRKRWMKKTQEQRKKLLLDAWPQMPRAHRPDFQAQRRERADQSQFRDSYLWPHMNQEDLARGRILLQLLNARGRNPPSTIHSFGHRERACRARNRRTRPSYYV